MKTLLVYSSRTGNTRKVAEAIREVLPEPLDVHPVEEAPDPAAYGCVILGFWVDKGMADAASRSYMEKIWDKAVGIFGTLGADPRSPYARLCLQGVLRALERQGNWILVSFLCQGKVDPRIIEAMTQSGAHPMTPERKARLEAASTHPDSKDCVDAQEAFRGIMEILDHAQDE
jgi:flavodoxin